MYLGAGRDVYSGLGVTVLVGKGVGRAENFGTLGPRISSPTTVTISNLVAPGQTTSHGRR